MGIFIKIYLTLPFFHAYTLNMSVRTRRFQYYTLDFFKYFKRHPGLYLLLAIPVIQVFIFKYLPMYGLQMAFMDFNPVAGYAGSEWIWFENFQKFFSSYVFLRLIVNTVGLSLYQLIAGFPIPIILAVCINELRSRSLKKTVQMVTYAPHFISMVVMVSIMIQVFSPHNGFVNIIITAFGGSPVNFMGKPEYFKSMYVWTGVWQNTGYSAIIYIAALSGIDPQIQEAAIIDGASKMQRIRHIDLPGIMPTAVILLILNCGRIMSVGFEKAFLMQNSMNITASEIISTYVYKVGLLNGDFAYSTTVNLFNSLINFILLVAVNKIANKVSDAGLW